MHTTRSTIRRAGSCGVHDLIRIWTTGYRTCWFLRRSRSDSCLVRSHSELWCAITCPYFLAIKTAKLGWRQCTGLRFRVEQFGRGAGALLGLRGRSSFREPERLRSAIQAPTGDRLRLARQQFDGRSRHRGVGGDDRRIDGPRKPAPHCRSISCSVGWRPD